MYLFLCSEQTVGLEQCMKELDSLKSLKETEWECFMSIMWTKDGAPDKFAVSPITAIDDSCFNSAELKINVGEIVIEFVNNTLSKYCNLKT